MSVKTFFPFQINKMSEAAIRKEYRRLRTIANKRAEHLAARGIGGKTAQKQFPLLSSLGKTDVAGALADVSHYLRDPRHTVRGELAFRKTVLQSLKENGIDYVNESNFYQYTEYMDQLREEYGNKLLDSSAANDVFNEGIRLRIDPELLRENFDYYAENIRALEMMKPARSVNGYTEWGLRDEIRKLTRKHNL